MAAVTHVFMLEYVTEILGEHPELIDAIVANDDNLSYGSIITVSAGPDDHRSAITANGINKLRNWSMTCADWLRSELNDGGAVAVITPKSNRKRQID